MRRFGQGFKLENEIKGKSNIYIYIYIYILFLEFKRAMRVFFFFGLVLPKKPPTSNVINAKKI